MDAEIGFTRAEMRKEPLAGKSAPPIMRHIFVVSSKPARDWESEYSEAPVPELSAALDKKLFRVTAVEAIPGQDSVGDLLVFPDFCRLRAAPQLSEASNLDDLIHRLRSPVPLLVGEDCEMLTGAQVFVCSHVQRDARCGYCGPELCQAFAQEEDASALVVRKCAHIGGHVYAGNVITFREPRELGEASEGDWFGYVTPSDVRALANWLTQHASGYPTHEIHPLWRGRAGLSEAAHMELCDRVCAACLDCNRQVADIEDGVAGRPALCVVPEETSVVTARVLFILGAPGSGKGTQCANLIRDYDLIHLSAGDLLRDERKNPDSKDGQLIETYIREGKIVPVAITVKLLWVAMQQHMRQGRCNFLIDGFPRNKDNLDGWNEQIPPSKARVVGVLFLDCAEDIVRERLLERGKTSGRSDDNLESIIKRFKTFVGETMPIVQHFAERGMCWNLDSSRAIDIVYADVRRVVEEFCLPREHRVVVLCTAPSNVGMEILLCKELEEEFDCVFVERDGELDSTIRARNVLVHANSPAAAAGGKVKAVLSLGADASETGKYSAVVIEVDTENARIEDVYSKVRDALRPVFLPPLFSAAAAEEKKEEGQQRAVAKTAPAVVAAKSGQGEEEEKLTKVLLAITAIAAVSLVAGVLFWRSKE